MAKSRSTAFFCKECGYETSKWMGQCPGCGQWNTLVEAPVESSVKKGISVLTQGGQAVPVRVSQIDTESENRFTSGLAELDRVLGGGIVTGSMVLVGGDPLPVLYQSPQTAISFQTNVMITVRNS